MYSSNRFKHNTITILNCLFIFYYLFIFFYYIYIYLVFIICYSLIILNSGFISIIYYVALFCGIYVIYVALFFSRQFLRMVLDNTIILWRRWPTNPYNVLLYNHLYLSISQKTALINLKCRLDQIESYSLINMTILIKSLNREIRYPDSEENCSL